MILARRLSNQKADVADGSKERRLLAGTGHLRRADCGACGGSICAHPLRRPSLPVDHVRDPEGDPGEEDDQGQAEELDDYKLQSALVDVLGTPVAESRPRGDLSKG